MHTKTKMLLIALCCLFSSLFECGAALRQTLFAWVGDGGYGARLSIRYDDSLAFVSASGGYPFATATNQGITELSITFLRPNGLTLFSHTNILNGVVRYGFLKIGLDTTSNNLLGVLDVGKDSFAEGEPGSPIGQFYLVSYPPSRPRLVDPSTLQTVDSGGEILSAPKLNISREGAASLRITWPAQLGIYILEYKTNLSVGDWSRFTVTNFFPFASNRLSVTFTADSQKSFFRLRKQ